MAMANDRVHPRKRKKVCSFCVDKVTHIDFKDTVKLRRYPAVQPVPAPLISVSSRSPSSAPVRSPCCPT